jgi:hypothetical protein
MADIITTVGKNSVAEKIGGLGSHADFEVLALGTSGTVAAVTNEALAAELVDSGLARATATASTATANILQLVKTWECTGTSKVIKECGILNHDTTGTLLARSNFTGIAVDPSDIIMITYKITVS